MGEYVDRGIRISHAGMRMIMLDQGEMNGIVVMGDRVVPARYGDDTKQRNDGQNGA
jgi:hypothetical protein